MTTRVRSPLCTYENICAYTFQTYYTAVDPSDVANFLEGKYGSLGINLCLTKEIFRYRCIMLLLYDTNSVRCLFPKMKSSKSAGYYVIPSAKNLRSSVCPSVRPSVRLSVRPSALRFRALT